MKLLDYVVGAARFTVIFLAPILFVRWLADDPAGCALTDRHYRFAHHMVPLLGLLADAAWLGGRHLARGAKRDWLRAVDVGLLFMMVGIVVVVCVGKTPHIANAGCNEPAEEQYSRSGRPNG